MKKGLKNPFTRVLKIKSTLEVMMFGRGSVFLLPFYKQKEKTKNTARSLTRLFVILFSTLLFLAINPK